MNKFVKGAKNLAFALSFVTVAACGNVKKADLEAGLKALEKKIDDKLDGKADNGIVGENQGYVRRSDLNGFVKNGDFVDEIDSRIGDLAKKVVGLDVLDKSFVKNPANFVKNFGGDVSLSDGVFRGGSVTFSEWDAKGVCKVSVKMGENEVFSVGTAAVLSDDCFDILKKCIGGGAKINWGGDMVFVKDTSNGINFIGKAFDISDKGAVLNLARLLDLCFLAGKKFENLGFDHWVVGDSSKIGGKSFASANKVENRVLVDVLNKFKEGCCVVDNEDAKITFKKGMGWTSDGERNKLVGDVDMAYSG